MLSRKERKEILLELKALSSGEISMDTEWYSRDEAYMAEVSDLLCNKNVQAMGQFLQHGQTSCLTHCLQVSYIAYHMAIKIGADARACARAGLLHDMFLYDWHMHKKETGNRFHGLTHPKVALQNACREFWLTDMEKNMILTHMWPLTIIPPAYREGYILMYCDKYCSISEVLQKASSRFLHRLGLQG